MRRSILVTLALTACAAFSGCGAAPSTPGKSDPAKDNEAHLRVKVWRSGAEKAPAIYLGPPEEQLDAKDKEAPPEKAILAVAFTDNRTVVAASAAGPVRVIDRIKPNAETTLAGTAPVAAAPLANMAASGLEGAQNVCLALSPDGQLLAIGGDGLRMVNAKNGELLAHLKDQPGKQRVQAAAFAPDGRLIVAAGSNLGFVIKVRENGRAGYVWRWHELPSISRQHGSLNVTITPTPTVLRVTPDSKTLLAVHPGYPLLTRCHAETGENIVNQIFSKPNNLTSFTAAAISPDGKLLAAAHNDGALRLWDVDGGNLRLELPDDGKSVTPTPHALAFSPDGNWLVAGRTDGATKFWDLAALLKK